MESYVTDELIALIDAQFPTTGARSISGHSMGGHGALTLALNHPDLFRSVSAFAPICSPTRCAWGEKAFTAYLGDDRATWDRYDAAKLITAGAARGCL
jgi:S-formylglutathione hydrolase